MWPLSYGTPPAASTGLRHFVRHRPARTHHAAAALAARVVADRAGDHAEAEAREQGDRRGVVLGDGEREERLAAPLGVVDDRAQECRRVAPPPMLRGHRDRDQIGEAGQEPGALDEREARRRALRLGDPRGDVVLPEERAEDRVVIAEASERRRPQGEDERRVAGAAGPDQRPCPCFTTTAHSAGVTGWTDRRLPLRRSAISSSPSISRISARVTGRRNARSTAISTAVQAASAGSGKPGRVTRQVPFTAFSSPE